MIFEIYVLRDKNKQNNFVWNWIGYDVLCYLIFYLVVCPLHDVYAFLSLARSYG